MEIRPLDTYRIDAGFEITSESFRVFLNLYQPIIGSESALVYMTLLSQSSHMQMQQSFSYLLKIMGNMGLAVFERACIRLEEMMLMKTYVRVMNDKSHFIFQLMPVLRAEDFFSTSIFAKQYMQAVGEKQYDMTLALMKTAELSKSGYKEVTHPVRITAEKYETEVVEKRDVVRFEFSEDDSINFDYERFISITPTIVFPTELRTQENMYIIGKMATIYGILPKDMVRLLEKCISLKDMSFNADRLKYLCAKEKPHVMQSDDAYDLPPISFLQSKMNGASVQYSERKLLEKLSLDFHFNNQVINVLIEAILNYTQNRLSEKFVLSVASTWSRENVKTKQDALEMAKKLAYQKNNRNVVKLDMPEYYHQPLSNEDLDNSPASSESLSKMSELLKKMGGDPK